MRICRAASGTWADANGDASRWLLSSQASTATIPISATLLILAWVLNWERLRRLDDDPLAGPPNDKAAVIAHLVNRGTRSNNRDRLATGGIGTAQPDDLASEQAGAQAARVRRRILFFAIVAALAALGALVVAVGGVPFGFGIRLPAPAALLILAGVGGLVWQFGRPPRRRS